MKLMRWKEKLRITEQRIRYDKHYCLGMAVLDLTFRVNVDFWTFIVSCAVSFNGQPSARINPLQ